MTDRSSTSSAQRWPSDASTALTDLALAGYNAGVGAVLQCGGIPPFPETQGYVSAIRWLAQQFTAPTGPPSAPGQSGASAGSFAAAEILTRLPDQLLAVARAVLDHQLRARVEA